MILLIFVLLMALAAALAEREEKIEALDNGGASRLVSALAKAYPDATSQDDYFKELNRAIETRKMVEEQGEAAAKQQLIEDAQLGREAREAATEAGMDDPKSYIRSVPEQLRDAKKSGFPPFFSLSEARGYYFDSGKATLRLGFEQNLRTEVIPRLARFIDEYGIDVVEVIGHTDEVPMVGVSNLDSRLIAASKGTFPIASLRSTDNAGLALARAVSVVTVLRSDPRLSKVSILPLSGAQMVVPVDKVADGRSAGSDQSRRRIEIRLRRTTEEAASGVVKETAG
jgi:flagellar motor protein MotB